MPGTLMTGAMFAKSPAMQHRVGMVVLAAGAPLASACPGMGTCDDPELIDVPFTSVGAQDAEVGGREVDGDFIFPHGATDTVSVPCFGGAGNTDGDDNFPETGGGGGAQESCPGAKPRSLAQHTETSNSV